MTISSMTGFGRGEGALNAHAWVWEVRSVNARGLDVRCRLPNGFEGLEPAVRQRFAAHLNRGSVTASLNLTHTASGGQVRINEDVLEQYLAAASALRQRLPDLPPPAIEGVLALRGVVETGDNVVCGEARAELDAALLLSLDPVIDALVQQRRTEGAAWRQSWASTSPGSTRCANRRRRWRPLSRPRSKCGWRRSSRC